MKTALRSLLQYPGTSLLAILLLGIGIGATTSAFTLLYNIALKPLPYPDSHELVVVRAVNRQQGENTRFLSYGAYRAMAQSLSSFESLSAVAPFQVASWRGNDEIVRSLNGALATAGTGAVLGLPLQQGRWFQEGEPDAVVISAKFWRTHLGAVPDVVGSQLWLDGRAMTVTGVVSREAVLPVWQPLVWRPFPAFYRQLDEPAEGNTFVWARLADGVSLEQARRQLLEVSEQFSRQYPQSWPDLELSISPLLEQFLPEDQRRVLVLLQVAGLTLLLLCTANVSGLLLLRAARQVHQLRIRRFLGAGTAHLCGRQLLEAAAVVGPGIGLGVVLAQVFTGLLTSVLPDMPRGDSLTQGSWLIMMIAVGAPLLALASALPPAATAMKLDLQGTLKGGGSAAIGPAARWMQSLLITAQIGVALVVLTGTGLMVRTLYKAYTADLGFRKEGIHFVQVKAADPRDESSVKQQIRRTLDEIRRLAAVDGAEFTSYLPLRTGGVRMMAEAGARDTAVTMEMVTPGYFPMMGIKLLRGRLLLPSDDAGSEPVIVISRTLAQRFFPGQDPIGQRLPHSRSFLVVGVVEDVRNAGLWHDRPPTVYQTLSQGRHPLGYFRLAISAGISSARIGESVRAIVEHAGSGLEAINARAPFALIDAQLGEQKLLVRVLAFLSPMALLLAAGGVFATVAFRSVQRIPEFGIRRACGATGRDIGALILGQGLRLGAGGLATGLLGALWTTRLLEGYLFEVEALDPASLIAAIAVLVLAVVCACLIPAGCALRVQPMEALRYE